LTSKIHLAVDERGLPLSVICTPGQVGNNPQLLSCSMTSGYRGSGPGGRANVPIT
jgi:transposase